MLPVLYFQVEIWTYRDATKLRMFCVNTEALKKIHSSEVDWIGSTILETDAYGKSHITASRKIVPPSEVYFFFWQRFGWRLFHFLNGAWIKIIKNKRRAGFISVWIFNSITIFEIKILIQKEQSCTCERKKKLKKQTKEPPTKPNPPPPKKKKTSKKNPQPTKRYTVF